MPRKVRKRKIRSSGWSENPKKMNMVTELFQVLVTVMLPTDHKDKRQTWVNNDITDAWTSGYTCMRVGYYMGLKPKGAWEMT